MEQDPAFDAVQPVPAMIVKETSLQKVSEAWALYIHSKRYEHRNIRDCEGGVASFSITLSALTVVPGRT